MIRDLHADPVYRYRGERTCPRSRKFLSLDRTTRERIADLGLVRRRRGCRAGRSARDRRRVYTETETAPGAIPVVSTVQTVQRSATIVGRSCTEASVRIDAAFYYEFVDSRHRRSGSASSTPGRCRAAARANRSLRGSRT